MPERSDDAVQDNPVEAARRAMRPPLRRRFYASAAAAPATSAAGGFAVRLDDKPARTPAGRPLVAPNAALVQAIAAEWNAQGESIDPATMPLTRLANTIIDGVGERSAAVSAEIEKYLASDLVCYRAADPAGLVERQARHWDPLLAWARDVLGADFASGEGVVHVVQLPAALAAARAAIPADPWRLGAVHAVTTLTGSALIALALAHKRLTADAAWAAAHVDEDWNMEQWGRDELAMQRRVLRLAEMQAAGTVLSALGE